MEFPYYVDSVGLVWDGSEETVADHYEELVDLFACSGDGIYNNKYPLIRLLLQEPDQHSGAYHD
jgi:hypothetical protein